MPLDPLSIGTAAVGALEAADGIISKIGSKKRTNKLLDQLDQIGTFKTDQGIYDIVNATLNQSQGDTVTREFQQNELDLASSDILGSALKMGGDANSLSNLLQMRIMGSMKIGEQFHQSNMNSFAGLMNSFKLLADNKDAEFFDKKQPYLNRLAAENSRSQSATANISGGVNTLISAGATAATKNIADPKGVAKALAGAGIDPASTEAAALLKQLTGNVTDADMFLSKV